MDLAGEWELMCKRTQKFASDGQENVRSVLASELIDGEVESLCQQQPPNNEEEMKGRRSQAADLSGRISLIVHAAWMARARVEVAEKVFELVHDCLRPPLAENAADAERLRNVRADAQTSIARLCRAGE